MVTRGLLPPETLRSREFHLASSSEGPNSALATENGILPVARDMSLLTQLVLGRGNRLRAAHCVDHPPMAVEMHSQGERPARIDCIRARCEPGLERIVRVDLALP